VGRVQIQAQNIRKMASKAHFAEIIGQLRIFADSLGAEEESAELVSVSPEPKWLPGLGSNQGDAQEGIYDSAQLEVLAVGGVEAIRRAVRLLAGGSVLEKGGAQRPDKQGQLGRDAALPAAGSQAGGSPPLGGAGEGAWGDSDAANLSRDK
jgi:hypothetical protein